MHFVDYESLNSCFYKIHFMIIEIFILVVLQEMRGKCCMLHVA